MRDTFNMGYDLQQAGYQFEVDGNSNIKNNKLLEIIADDFVSAASKKAGINCNKQTILSTFSRSLKKVTANEPILICYITGDAQIDVKSINRSNPLLHNLFVEVLG